MSAAVLRTHTRHANELPNFSWTKGANRPHDGQIDIYEHWNQETHNQPAFHTGNSTELGNCILDGERQTAPVATANNCDNGYENPPAQSKGQGCSASDVNGAWADNDGGVCKFLRSS